MQSRLHVLSIIGLAGIAMAGSPALAQTESVTVGGLKWKPVEQTVGDRGPLSTSQLMVPVDLRLQTGFQQVYQLDAKPRFFGDNSEYYMRRNAGVTAIFPRSTYTQTRQGLVIDVPAGTVYSIGGDLNQLVPSQPQAPARVPSNAVPGTQPTKPSQPERTDKPAAPTRPDYRVPTQPPAEAPAADKKPKVPETAARPEPRPQPSAPAPKSIWSDDAFRQERISKLLDQAAQGK